VNKFMKMPEQVDLLINDTSTIDQFTCGKLKSPHTRTLELVGYNDSMQSHISIE